MDAQWISEIQQTLSPSVRSRGASLARDAKFYLELQNDEEIRIQVSIPGQAVNRTVQLWPQDVDAYCDCKDRDDPCVHIAACLVRLKSGEFDEQDAQDSSTVEGLVRYVFSEDKGALTLERRVRFRGQDHRITQSLVSLVGAMQAGRAVPFRAQASQFDFGVELALKGHIHGPIKKENTLAILKALESSIHLTFKESTVRASGRQTKPVLEIEGNSTTGFRLSVQTQQGEMRFFNNGAALIDGVLRPSAEILLSQDEISILQSTELLTGENALRFFSEVLPRIQGKIELKNSGTLPECVALSPYWSVQIAPVDTTRVLVTPRLQYGSPPLAEITSSGELRFLGTLSDPIPIRNIEAERKQYLNFRSLTGLHASSEIRLTPSAAQEWLERFDSFRAADESVQSLLEPTDIQFSLDWPTDSGTSPTLRSSVPLMGRPEDWIRQFVRGETLVPLLSGGFARMPSDFMERYANLLAEVFDPNRPEKERRFSGALLRAEAQDTLRVHDLSLLRQWYENKTELPPPTLPNDLRASLRPYQEEGIRWLQFLKTLKLGGILADDMGLGKTLQTLCVLDDSSLVIAPTSVLHSWRQQIERFRPGLKIQWHYGKDRAPFVVGQGVVLTSYGVMRLNPSLFQNITWSVLVLDEAQILKNPESLTRAEISKIEAESRFLLSGTPIENRFLDLWSLLDLSLPGMIGPAKQFEARLQGSEGRHLRDRFRPFILRRMKSSVAQDLPPKTEIVLRIPLSEEEQGVYDTLRTGSNPESLKTLEILEKILRLRQACNHLALLDPSRSGTSSSKVNLLLDLVENALEQGHRLLIFSQWTSLLDEVGIAFRKRLIPFARLDGQTRNRSEIVSEFQSGAGTPVLLMTLKAGGVGLTLTEADQVILLDPWWNPAAEDQATDRAHRIGQTRPVLIQRLIAEGTIEERILDLQEAKRAQLASVLEDTPDRMELDRADFLALLRS